MSDLSGIFESLGSKNYTLKRTAASTVSAGRAVVGSTSITTIRAMVTPAKPAEVERLADATQTTDIQAVLSKTLMSQGDVIVIDGADYEVNSVESWVAYGNFYRALAARKGR